MRIDALEVLNLVVADKEITGLWQGFHLVDWHDAVVQIEVDREGVHAVGFQHIGAIRADGGRRGDGLLDSGGHTAVGLDLHDLRNVHAVEAQLQEEDDASEREEIGALIMAAIVDGQQGSGEPGAVRLPEIFAEIFGAEGDSPDRSGCVRLCILQLWHAVIRKYAVDRAP